MSGTYKIALQGVKDGFSKDQVVDALAELFKRPKEQVLTILAQQAIVKKGVDSLTAEKYCKALEQCGCVCTVTAEDEPAATATLTLEPKAPSVEPLSPSPAIPAPAAAMSSRAPANASDNAPANVRSDKRASAESQFDMGEKYEYGRGVPQDFAKAAVWYRRAAEQGHAAAQEKLHSVWLDGDLTPVKSAPSLFTLNGMGFKLYGSSEHDPDSDSFMTTHYFVFLFLPIFPIARYRVISPESGMYRFLGKGKLRKFDKLHIALAAGMFLWFCIAARLR